MNRAPTKGRSKGIYAGARLRHDKLRQTGVYHPINQGAGAPKNGREGSDDQERSIMAAGVCITLICSLFPTKPTMIEDSIAICCGSRYSAETRGKRDAWQKLCAEMNDSKFFIKIMIL